MTIRKEVDKLHEEIGKQLEKAPAESEISKKLAADNFEARVCRINYFKDLNTGGESNARLNLSVIQSSKASKLDHDAQILTKLMKTDQEAWRKSKQNG